MTADSYSMLLKSKATLDGHEAFSDEKDGFCQWERNPMPCVSRSTSVNMLVSVGKQQKTATGRLTGKSQADTQNQAKCLRWGPSTAWFGAKLDVSLGSKLQRAAHTKEAPLTFGESGLSLDGVFHSASCDSSLLAGLQHLPQGPEVFVWNFQGSQCSV